MEIGSISIRYGDLALIAQRLKSIQENISLSAGKTDLGFQLDGCYRAGHYLAPLGTVKSDLATSAQELGSLSVLLDDVVALCEERERRNKAGLENTTAAEGFSQPTTPPAGHADEYYGGLDEAAAQKKKDEDDAKKADEERKAKREALMAYFAERFPLAYAAYMEKVNAAADEAWLEKLKNSDDPEDRMIYEMIMEQKRLEEEAAKAAEEAAKVAEESGQTGMAGEGTLGEGLSEMGLSGLGGSDSGFEAGGGGSFGGLDSGFGEVGGSFGGLDSGWESDLLDDAVDSSELLGAEGALEDVTQANNPAATDVGTAAAVGDVAMDEAEEGVLNVYGEKLASLASAYGLQAAAVAGAGIALYATREQTTEAVAHVAEFISTRCKPFASDVMDQVSGAAKKTRVKVSNAKSRIVAAERSQKAGDLIV